MRTASAHLPTRLLIAGALLAMSTTATLAEDVETPVQMPAHAVIVAGNPGTDSTEIEQRVADWKRTGMIADSRLWQAKSKYDEVTRVYVTFDFGRTDKDKLVKDFTDIGGYLALGSKNDRKVEVSFVENSIATTDEVMGMLAAEWARPVWEAMTEKAASLESPKADAGNLEKYADAVRSNNASEDHR